MSSDLLPTVKKNHVAYYLHSSGQLTHFRAFLVRRSRTPPAAQKRAFLLCRSRTLCHAAVLILPQKWATVKAVYGVPLYWAMETLSAVGKLVTAEGPLNLTAALSQTLSYIPSQARFRASDVIHRRSQALQTPLFGAFIVGGVSGVSVSEYNPEHLMLELCGTSFKISAYER
ncbi:Uncharacterized protein Fot_18266 [Forsythia ovata]|uniref:Uncharacterized protein n=1 Tax=Forsythia ovata TaxID=205694 RepID=A0ABD1VHP8_9LAMI